LIVQKNLIGRTELKDLYVIDTIDALRALSDPLRLRVLEALHAEPLTASQIARRLEEKPNKLHYHLTELERNGLVEVVETRQKGNLLEKYYRPVARIFRVDNSLFERASGADALSVLYQNVVTTLDMTAADLKTALQAGTFGENEAAGSLRTLLRWRFSAEDAAEFRRRLNELIQEFSARSRQDAPLRAALTLIFYTLAPESGAEAIEAEPTTLDRA
jgi:DNA-binding transcriptional ArsR family regulator